MSKVVFKTTAQLNDIIDLLSKTVSPRAYYIHTSVGGTGWQVQWDRDPTIKTVSIEDGELATFAMLKLK